jgi:hypothetical protein
MNSSYKCTKQVLQAAVPAFVAAEPQKHGFAAGIMPGSSPLLQQGEERFSAPKKAASRQGALALGTYSGDFAAKVTTQCWRQFLIPLKACTSSAAPSKAH